MQVLDAAELEFPFNNLTMFKGLERFPEVLADPASLRRAYLQEFDAFVRGVKTGARTHQMDYQLIRSDQSLGVALSSYLASRAAMVK